MQTLLLFNKVQTSGTMTTQGSCPLSTGKQPVNDTSCALLWRGDSGGTSNGGVRTAIL